jgi:hypothetical protein
MKNRKKIKGKGICTKCDSEVEFSLSLGQRVLWGCVCENLNATYICREGWFWTKDAKIYDVNKTGSSENILIDLLK